MPEARPQETGTGSTHPEGIRPGAARRPIRAGRQRRAAGRSRRDDLLWQDRAQEWIRAHQDAALVAAFAVGVFIGAWMRG